MPKFWTSRPIVNMTSNNDNDASETLLTGQQKPPKDRQILTIVVTDNGTKVKETIPLRKKFEDRFNLVYFIMLLLGVGSLLPWNFFITAHAYFTAKLKGTHYQHDFENYFALAAFGPNIITFFLNTLFKHKVSLKVRMLVPLAAMTMLFIVTAAFVRIDTDGYKGGFFAITLATIGLINVFSAVFQGGLFGLSGMMPPRYTQAVMSGQGVGGIFACVADIGSKLGTSNPLNSALWYFVTAVVCLSMCFLAYLALYRIPFSSHFLSSHREEVEYQGQTTVQDENDYSDTPRLTNGITKQDEVNVTLKKATPPFLVICKQIWRFALSVFFIFFVTLSVFPSVISGIKSKHKDDGSEWTGKFFTPVVCFLLFNVGDFGGRFLAGLVQKPGKGGYWLLSACVSRVIFLPLFALCNYQPRRNQTVLFHDDYWPIMFNIFFAVSNGYLGSLCMMYGPSVVDSKHAETAGTMMAFFLALGLSAGGAMTFAITKSV